MFILNLVKREVTETEKIENLDELEVNSDFSHRILTFYSNKSICLVNLAHIS